MLKRVIRKSLLSAILLYTLFFIIQTAWSSSAQIYLKNDSSSDEIMQVVDQVCKLSKDTECNSARTFLQNQGCLQNPYSNECKEARSTVDSACACEQARNMLKSSDCRSSPGSQLCKEAIDKIESSSCVEGLIFEGTVRRGTKIPIFICMSSSGYGRISVRQVMHIWKNYNLINAGDTVSYP